MSMICIDSEKLQQLIRSEIQIAVRNAFREHEEELAPAGRGKVSPDYYTVQQLAQKWAVSTSTIWRHVKLRHIKCVKVGRRVLFEKSYIDSAAFKKSAQNWFK